MYRPLFDNYIGDSQEKTGLYKKTLMLGGRIVFTAHHDGTEEAQDEALRRCDEVAIGLVEKVTAKLGRRPCDKELRRGLDHPETRRAGDIIRQRLEYGSYFQQADEDERTPLERARDARRLAIKSQGDPRLAMLNEAVEKEKEATEREAAKQARADDPRRPACIEDASAVAIAVAFDPDATQADLERSAFMVRLAQNGDPLAYQNLRQTHQREEAAKRREKAAPLHERAATLASEIQRLEEPFILPASSVEYCPGESAKLPEGLHLSE